MCDHCHCHDHEHEHDHEEEGCGCGCGHEHGHGEGEDAKREMLILGIRVAISLALALLGLLWLNEDNFPWYVNLIVMGVSWLVVSYDVAWKSLKAIFKGHNPFDECLLMTVASIGAFCLRLFGPDHNEYFEAVMVMLLYQLGEFFEDLAADKSREAITSAIDLRDSKASIIGEDGSISLKSPEDIHVGDVVLLKVGEKCLSDGVVIEGEGNVDESSITGEFVPVKKEKEAMVLSGTILKSGSLKIRVEKEYEDSTVAKLLELVEHSASKKSKADRFISKFSRIYTPVVMALAVLVAIIPPLFLGVNDGAVWSRWIFTALCFLVISCPCAIVISVPLAYFAGLGLASKNGIIVKGAEYFDKLNEMKLVAFDKTGTITKGEFVISEISPIGIDEETFMDYLVAAESRSNHPIAQAICKDKDLGVYSEAVDEYEEIPGIGVAVLYKGHKVSAIKKPLIEENACQKIGTLVYLVVDDKDNGHILLNDTIKPTSVQAISTIKVLGRRTMLLSGDKKANVAAIATEVGVDEYHAELIPEEKIAFLEKEMAKKDGMVGFVGDGINDAPSIVGADVGMGMGGLGSDVVVQNADVVFMDDDISKVSTVIKIAKKTERRALFNIVVALVIKFSVMLAAALWEGFPLWLATFADSGLALLLTLNSLMLINHKVK